MTTTPGGQPVGVTTAGWAGYPADSIYGDLSDAFKAQVIGAAAGTDADGRIPKQSLAGALLTVMTDGFAALWDALGVVYASLDPAQAADAALNALCAITGTTREGAKFSQVYGQMYGTSGTWLRPSLAAVVAITAAGDRFDLMADVQLQALPAWQANDFWQQGVACTKGGQVYMATSTGTTGSSGPSGQGQGQIDGGVTWNWICAGTGMAAGEWQAEVAGKIAVPIGALATIATPVSGWSAVSNLDIQDVTGQIVETDAALRLRRQEELAGGGNADVDAIRAHVIAAKASTSNPILSCRVCNNRTDSTDGNGLTPHSVRVLIHQAIESGDPDAAIAAALFASVGAGTAMLGSVSTTVKDASGASQPVKYDRPSQVPVYVTVEATYDPATFPMDDDGVSTTKGQGLIKDALLIEGQSYLPGVSVRASVLEAAVLRGPTEVLGAPCPGIIDVTAVKIGISPSPSGSTTIPITAFQIATFDATRMVVTLVAGSP